jgi:hypothetical protein
MVFLFVVGLTIHYRRERSIGKNKEPNSFLWHFVVLGEWTLGVLSGRVFPCTNTEDHRERARYVFWSSYATFFKATVVGGMVSLFSILSLTREAASPFVAGTLERENIVFLRGETARAMIQKLGGHPVPVDSFLEGFRLLKAGKAMAMIEQEAFLEFSLKQYKITEKVDYLPLLQNELAFASENPALIRQIDQSLLSYRDGLVGKLCRKYFNNDSILCDL